MGNIKQTRGYIEYVHHKKIESEQGSISLVFICIPKQIKNNNINICICHSHDIQTICMTVIEYRITDMTILCEHNWYAAAQASWILAFLRAGFMFYFL